MPPVYMSARAPLRRLPAGSAPAEVELDTAGRRVCRCSGGHVLWRTISRVGTEVEARGVRTTGGGYTNQRENCNARPCKRARLHHWARHVVTHSYAENVEFE